MSSDFEYFKLRLTAAERERLDKEAGAKGLTKADYIREKLGWKRRRSPSLPAGESLKTITKAAIEHAEGEKPDPEAQPGLAGLEAVAQRIFGSEGVPMREARKRAKKLLQDDA